MDKKVTKTKASRPARGDKPDPGARSGKNRRQEIIEKAAEFFANFGFDASTRDFAKCLGTTQPLIYRYFETKEALIQEVYRFVYLDLWKDHWDDILINRNMPLRDRLVEFYNLYTDAIMNPKWMRLYLFAGLKGVKINDNYLKLVEKRVIRRIIIEFWADRGIPLPDPVSNEDLEIVYTMHSGIFYYGIRSFVYRVPTYAPKALMIQNAVDIFVDGYDAVLKRRLAGKGEAVEATIPSRAVARARR